VKIPEEMRTRRIQSVEDLIALLGPRLSPSGADPIYRGHSDANWTLRPRLFRHRDLMVIMGGWRQLEDHLLDKFQRRATPFLVTRPERPLDWLSLMQHNRLPTRLLDWTTDPLTALWFAVSGDVAQEACVWEYWPLEEPELGARDQVDSSDEPREVKLWEPGAYSGRITAQHSVHTIHPLPAGIDEFTAMDNSDDEAGRLRQFLIPDSVISAIRSQLDRLGYGPGRLFPDLEGAAQSILWELDVKFENIDLTFDPFNS